MNMSKEFEEWSANWKRLKSAPADKNSIELVAEQWKIPPPPHTFGRLFPNKIGSRKKSAAFRGEQKIEIQLLGPVGGSLQVKKIAGSTVKDLTVYAIFNNFAAAKLKGSTKGQVIADVFGILRVGKKYHPISIEVKDTADNCWSAVVQNLQQVRFFRAQGADFQVKIQNHGEGFVPPQTKLGGVWGMVLAPPKYWKKQKKLIGETESLLMRMTKSKSSRARVLLASIDEDSGEIKLVGGHKFRSQFTN